MLVAALRSPPAASISSAMARALTPPRALEGHMLQEMRKAVLAGALVARAGADPDAERGGLEMRHGVGDDAQSRGQSGDARGHEAALLAEDRVADEALDLALIIGQKREMLAAFH